MRPFHVFWIVVDCVRNYDSGNDERDKLPVFFELDREWVHFPRMLSPAPSSIMAIGAALTGVPAYYLSPDYENFEISRMLPPSLPQLLARDHGYRIGSVLNARAVREKLEPLIPHVASRYYKRTASHRDVRWSNHDVQRMLFDYLDDVVLGDDPLFTLVWYNARRDRDTSDIVRETVDRIFARGLEDSSVIVVHSDHGYPDARRGLVRDGCDLGSEGIPHDIIVTDDNLLVPCYVHFPGAEPHAVEGLHQLTDLAPTVCGLLGLANGYFDPRFAIDALNGNRGGAGRTIRVDNRFFRQGQRLSAIYRDGLKYVVEHDGGRERIFDLESDPWEERDLLGLVDGKTVDAFRHEFEQSQAELEPYLIDAAVEAVRPAIGGSFEVRLHGFGARGARHVREKFSLASKGRRAVRVIVCRQPLSRGKLEEIYDRQSAGHDGRVVIVDPDRVYLSRAYSRAVRRDRLVRRLRKSKIRLRWILGEPTLVPRFIARFLGYGDA